MPRMTAKEAVEKLREYYYPGQECEARMVTTGDDSGIYADYRLHVSPNGDYFYGVDFEECFAVLDRLIAEGKVKSGMPGDTAPEIESEEYGWIHHDEERCKCGRPTKDGGLCPECLQVQAEHMADVKENR